MIGFTDVPESKALCELPVTWSVPTPGETCKMVVLQPADPEYIEVERNVRKTSNDSLRQIVSVSEICGLC